MITKDGVTGVDVNHDGKPDIGPHGEILKDAPIVQGPDGSLGIDVNGDGKPDIGISGQVLPDAPIVTHHGVTGIDVNGDCKPDIGMDGKPLPGAHTVTKDGVTGVDVNPDGKPDIAMDGTILKDAPLATSPDGIKGIDVNGDGKPDIALSGGQAVPQQGTSAIYSPQLPTASTTSNLQANTAVPSSAPGGYTSSGIGNPYTASTGSQNPSSVLTSAGPGSTLTSASTAVPPGSPTLASTPTPVLPEAARLNAGMPMMMGGGGFGAIGGPDTQHHQARLAEDEEVWESELPGGDSLGRPST
jgi:hypothetical protein